MSSSHAPSESMLLHDAELAPPEVPIGQPVPGHRYPFSIKKVFKVGGVAFLVVALAGAVVTIALLANQLSELTIRVNSLDAAFRSGQIGQLAASVSSQENRIKTLKDESEQRVADQTREINRLSGELLSVKTQADKAVELAGTLQQSLSSTEERVSKLESELSKSMTAMNEQARQSTEKTSQQARTQSAREPVSRTGSTEIKKAKRSVSRIAAPAAPFSLTGIERRGGHTFAVIVPSGASAVSQMKLLSPGDVSGGWVLRAISGNEAVFMFNGAERRLSVQ
ncbi:plasmid transfer protein [Klebsiella pneumoniae]